MTTNWRVYFSSGARLSWARVDDGNGQVTVLDSVMAPDNVQYGVADAAGRYLYLATSDGGPGLPPGVRNQLSCWAIDADSGALTPHGAPQALPSRPLHLSMAADGGHLLLAFHQPAAFDVYRIAADGSVGSAVPQDAAIDPGVFPHQIRATPGDGTVLVCARGNEAQPSASAPAQPGALLTFRYVDGQLSPLARHTPPDGLGPRGLAWHPNGRWAYVAFELGNQLGQYALVDGAIRGAPEYLTSTLADPDSCGPGPAQRAGAIQLHPNGRTLYVTNRADQTTLVDGTVRFAGGENNIAVFRLDETSGQPGLLQHIATEGIEPRTMAISPDGRVLIVGNQTAIMVDANDRKGPYEISPCITIFHIQEDGKLILANRFDCPVTAPLIWMSIIPGRHNA